MVGTTSRPSRASVTRNEWEDQDKYRGGWELKDGKLELKNGSREQELVNLFHNPHLPEIDDYYEPWDYDYEKLIDSPEERAPAGGPTEIIITGEKMDKSNGDPIGKTTWPAYMRPANGIPI